MSKVLDEARARYGPDPSANGTHPKPPLAFPPIKHISELARPPGQRWLVEGYLARGKFTLLTALWKVGKTTWLAHLLKGFKDGGTFCGRNQQAGRVLYVTEEDEDLWVDRREELGLGGHPVHLLTQPFGFARANAGRWSELLCYLAEFQAGPTPADLIVFDTLSNLWPVGDENDAAKVGEALAPIRLLTAAAPHPAILLNHHNRKSDGAEFTGTRGSGALPSFVDIIVEMRRFAPDDDDDNRRVLKGGGRFRKDTPSELVVELTEGGYDVHGTRSDVAGRDLAATIRGILADGVKRTWKGVRDDWPGDHAPATKRLLDALKAGLDRGLWSRDGEGRKTSPHLYFTAAGGAGAGSDEPIPE